MVETREQIGGQLWKQFKETTCFSKIIEDIEGAFSTVSLLQKVVLNDIVVFKFVKTSYADAPGIVFDGTVKLKPDFDAVRWVPSNNIGECSKIMIISYFKSIILDFSETVGSHDREVCC